LDKFHSQDVPTHYSVNQAVAKEIKLANKWEKASEEE